MRSVPPVLTDPAPASLQIRPWPDPVIDQRGVDPRSGYVEQYWLGILGPSTTWLLRRLVAGLEASPAGYELDLAETAAALGLAGPGRNGPFVRALTRCCQFELAHVPEDGVLAVRRRIPPLSARQVARLPEALQAAHRRWQEAQAGAGVEAVRRRTRRLALSLVELGEDLEATERQLMRWRFHPALCHEAAVWAWKRHQQAAAEAAEAVEARQPA